MPQFRIASFEDAQKILLTPGNGVTDVVSIGGPNSERPKGYAEADVRKLRLEFDDVTEDSAIKAGYVPPSEQDVRTLIKFVARSRARQPQPRNFLFHCAAGISRSAAAATIMMVMLLPEGHEHTAVDMVRLCKPDIYPNRRMIAYADKLLCRGGKLIKAMKSVYVPKLVMYSHG